MPLLDRSLKYSTFLHSTISQQICYSGNVIQPLRSDLLVEGPFSPRPFGSRQAGFTTRRISNHNLNDHIDVRDIRILTDHLWRCPMVRRGTEVSMSRLDEISLQEAVLM